MSSVGFERRAGDPIWPHCCRTADNFDWPYNHGGRRRFTVDYLPRVMFGHVLDRRVWHDDSSSAMSAADRKQCDERSAPEYYNPFDAM